jgi:hypothetical protein
MKYTGILFLGSSLFLFVLFRILHVATNSAVLYLLKDVSGVRLTTDVSLQEADSIVFTLDATGFFNQLFESVAVATNTPLLDLSYDAPSGRGLVKEFRTDGTRLQIALSRHIEEEGEPKGVVIGGDFPAGDARSQGEGGGMAFFDGSKWIHLWCTANEGIGTSHGDIVYEPHKWDYIGGRIVKKNYKEVIIKSMHEVVLNGDPVSITRFFNFRAGEDFVTLMIRVFNTGDRAVLYDYAYGDEPWVGKFGTSEGEVGWYEGGLINRETYIDPRKYSYIGYADFGNKDAGEAGIYSGYANFIQWSGEVPSMVYLSNDFHSVRNRVLDSKDNRILNIVWKNQYLLPGENKTYLLKIGFVRPGKSLFDSARLLAGNKAFAELQQR